jgi:hypothetical protein
LRLAAEQGERFDRIVAANTGLPTGDQKVSEAFKVWQQAVRKMSVFDVGRVVQSGTVGKLPPEVVTAYDAPFPDESYKAGARIFPALVPTTSDDPAAPANREAWKALRRWQKPFQVAVSASFTNSFPARRANRTSPLKAAGTFFKKTRARRSRRWWLTSSAKHHDSPHAAAYPESALTSGETRSW